MVVWDLRAVADGAQSSGLCSGSGAVDVLYVPSDSYGERFYVVCGGGGVEHVTLDSSTIPVSLSASDEIEVNLGSGGSIGLAFAPGDDAVYATIQDSSTYSLDRIPLSSSSGNSELLGHLLTGTAVATSVSSTGSPLVVARSDGYLSNFERSGSSYSSPSTLPFLALGSLSDVVVSYSLGLILATDKTNGEVWAVVIDTTTALEWGGGFSSPTALAEGSDGGGPLIWVAEEGGGISAWDSTQAAVVDLATGQSGLVAIAVSLHAFDLEGP